MAFEVYREQLQTVSSFKYLGTILTEGEDDWMAVTGNLGKARKSWGILQRILSREVATKRVSGDFFKAVVQQVLLFGAETWVVSPRMERALSSFIHGSARRITGRQPRRGWDGKWLYPSLVGAMKEAGFTDVRTSINRRQNTVGQYIVTRLLLDLCKGGDAARRGEGNNEVVVPEGNKLGEGKIEGSGDGIGARIGDRHGRGGETGRRTQGKRLEWGGMERRECRRMGSNAN